MEKCKKHPKYKAIRKPSGNCEKCAEIWGTKMVPKMNSIEEEQNFWDNVENAFEYSDPVDLKIKLPAKRQFKNIGE